MECRTWNVADNRPFLRLSRHRVTSQLKAMVEAPATAEGATRANVTTRRSRDRFTPERFAKSIN